MLRLLVLLFFLGCARSTSDNLFNLLLLQIRASKTTLSGLAIKGAYKSALVEVYPLTQEGDCDIKNLLDKNYTDSYGRYSLTYQRTGTLVCVKVKPDPRGKSRLYDEKTRSDLVVPSDSGLVLDMVLPETSFVGRRNPVATSPISHIIASRFANLAKGNSDPKQLTRFYQRASKEMVIRFGLNKKVKLSKNLSGDEVPTLDELPINWNDPQDPYAINYLAVLAGFSQLAYSQKQSSTVSANDIYSVIEVFAKDASDGVFDGKDVSGNSLSLPSGQALGTDPLTNHLAPAIQTFLQEGGKLGTTSNIQISVNTSELLSAISFQDSTPIIFSDTTPTVDSTPIIFSDTTPTVATPTFNPPAGNQISLSNITISTTTSGATIYYTTNGTNPTTSSSVYVNPLVNVWILAGKTIKAFATKTGMLDSGILSGVFSYPPFKTGQTNCWDDNGYSIACSSTKQDGDLQKGIARGHTDNGDGTVTDNATGLIWQKCSRGQNNDATCTGTATTDGWSDALSYCNGLSLAGKTWRLPTRQELETLVHYGASDPSTDTITFPSTVSDKYWSSTTFASLTNNAWTVSFDYGKVISQIKTNTLYVRCVSGPSRGYSSHFVDNGDGTITDKTTGLTWQKCSRGQNNDATCTGTATADDWSNALSYCNGLSLAGKTWRLPNINELNSIPDTTKASGATIDTGFFPNTSNSSYWSSTTDSNSNDYAWYIDFYDGNLDSLDKIFSRRVRCVSGP